MLFHKYIKLKNKYFTELEPVNTELKLLNDRKFILENIIKKRDFEIGRYEVSLEVFYAPLVREDKREIFSNNIDIDEDSIIYNLEKSQTTLLNKLKDFNKYHNKATELKKEKEILVKILKKLKGKRNINNFSVEEKNILYNKNNSRKNKYSQNIQDISNSLINSIDGNESILSDIMNDTINSEYEDEEYIEFISLQKNYKPLILNS